MTDHPNTQHLQNLIATKIRRLEKLEEKAAYFGAHTPVHILLEIEDLERELAALQRQLADLDTDYPNKMKISREMRNALPTSKYLALVAQYLLEYPGSQTDPFDPYPTDRRSTYVCRPAIEAELDNTRSQIITGPSGAGKTTLFEWLPALIQQNKPNVLVVSISLTDLNLPEKEQAQIIDGKAGLLSGRWLSRYVFESYWQNLFLNVPHYQNYYPFLRSNRSWRNKLHWFYHHYHQTFSQKPIPDELFELVSWMTCCSPDDNRSPQDKSLIDILSDLITLITQPLPQGLSTHPPEAGPYQGIQILLDGLDQLSTSALERLARDIQSLHKQIPPPTLHFKLFSGAQQFVNKFSFQVYQLPVWTESDLQKLLLERLSNHNSAIYSDPAIFGNFLPNWVQRIPATHLDRGAQTKLIDIITQYALHPDGNPQSPPQADAPLHALMLARIFLVGSTGLWAHDFPPPLSVADLKNLAKIYWY